MQRIRLFILASAIVAITLGSTLVIGIGRPTAPTSKPQDPLFTYTAKFICNIPVVDSILNTLQPNRAETIGLVPGEYKTDINVHNANLTTSFTIKKEFVVSVPEAPIVGNNTKVLLATVLGPDGAFFIDCADILGHLPGFCFPTPRGLICKQPTAKGYVVLTTDTPNLDVVAEYSALSVNATAAPFEMTGISLDVEHIRAVALPSPVCTPGSTITVAPASLTIPVGVAGSATISITNTGCVPITECFTLTVPPGITASVSPVCISIPAGPGTLGFATISVVCTTAGIFPVVITANSVTPPIVQTATLTVTCV